MKPWVKAYGFFFLGEENTDTHGLQGQTPEETRTEDNACWAFSERRTQTHTDCKDKHC